MSTKQEYSGYYASHPAYNQQRQLASDTTRFPYFRTNVLPEIQKLGRSPKELRVLEIGCGYGSFAYYCHEFGIGSYVGFDLDLDAIESDREKLPGYSFHHGEPVDNKEVEGAGFDVVFMSHVFEHFEPKEASEYCRFIRNRLVSGGIWVNIMPNAASLFFPSVGRYADVTHKTLYTPNSFSQVLISAGFGQDDISHRNSLHSKLFLESLRRCVKVFLSVVIRGL